MPPDQARRRFPFSFDRLRRRSLLRRFLDRRELFVDPSLSAGDGDRLAAALEDVLSQREPATRRASAALVLSAYASLDEVGRERFFRVLAERFAPDTAVVDSAIAAVRYAATPPERVSAERALRRALTPRFAALLHVFTGLPNGVKLLVDLRADLLAARSQDPALQRLDDELAGHLSTLFDVGLLELRRITWDGSSAALLERLIGYEAVHEINSWDELKHRLDSDQRCYAFLHPAMPDEPLVFVEAALTKGLAGDVTTLLYRDAAVTDPQEADTAIFYSITSCQRGLAGIQLGNELIKHVVEELGRDLPRLRTFATLSPIPGFRAWADEVLTQANGTPGERASFGDDPEKVRALLADGDLSAVTDNIRSGLLSMCARYLTTARAGRSMDSVANFHLSNGARVERLNWLANAAPYEFERSFGIMANYRYNPSSIASNVAAYLSAGTIDASSQVRNLIR